MKDQNKISAIDSFLDKEEESNKKEVIKSKDGLIERFDKVYVTQNGKQLLKEIYR